MNIIKGAAEINKAIASIKNRGGRLDADIHAAGVAVLAHASEHGDTTLASRLVEAMPKGSRKLAIVEWMLAFGQIAKLNPKNPDHAARIKAGEVFTLDRTRTLDIAGAQETSWVEFRKEPAVATAFDVQAALKGVLARLNAAAANGLSIEHKAEALEQVRALAAVLEA